MIRLLAHPFQTHLSLPLCRQASFLTREGEGVGEEPDHATTPSINHTMLSASTVRMRTGLLASAKSYRLTKDRQVI
jgi:hypothetical protein